MKSHLRSTPRPDAATESPSLEPYGADAVVAALRDLHACSAASEALRLELPASGAMRMRKLVHRGTQRPVFKVPSLKLRRAVHCESLLEVDGALLFDTDPSVRSFTEQPARLHFAMDGVRRHHVPDFALLIGPCKALVEIKFRKDIDAAVRERTVHLRTQLAPVGWNYLLLSDEHLRQGSQVANALSIRRRARHARDHAHLLVTLERLRQGQALRLGDFGWRSELGVSAFSLAKLLISGHARADLWYPLTDDTAVEACDPRNAQEVASWLLAHSA